MCGGGCVGRWLWRWLLCRLLWFRLVRSRLLVVVVARLLLAVCRLVRVRVVWRWLAGLGMWVRGRCMPPRLSGWLLGGCLWVRSVMVGGFVRGSRWIGGLWRCGWCGFWTGLILKRGPGRGFPMLRLGVWWESYVERLAELGVTAGCATGPERYCPDGSVTRGQMATFLRRAYGLADAEPAGFVDTGGDTHEASIDALYAAGVTAGCGTGPLRYCPQKPVTRAQMATFLLRASTGAVVAAPSPGERAVVVEEMVDEAGGVVEAGGVTVTVPAGALGEAVVVAVREPLGSFRY